VLLVHFTVEGLTFMLVSVLSSDFPVSRFDKREIRIIGTFIKILYSSRIVAPPNEWGVLEGIHLFLLPNEASSFMLPVRYPVLSFALNHVDLYSLMVCPHTYVYNKGQ